MILGCLAVASNQAHAQAYPARPIRLVIPYAPGGPTDILGRAVANKLGELLGQQVVVESRAGVSAILAPNSSRRQRRTDTRYCSPTSTTRSTPASTSRCPMIL